MRAFLVRHGEATSGTDTPTRPLTAGGRDDVEKVGGAIARLGSGPAIILHSGKTRAAETANLLAARLAPRDGVTEVGWLDPLAEPSIAVDRIETGGESVMIVGHLPHVSRVASLLLVRHEDRELLTFGTATAAALDRGGEGWRLRWLITPGAL